MAFHNYIPAPSISPGALVATAPYMSELTGSLDERVNEHDEHQQPYARNAILGGDPPIIVGHECILQWDRQRTFADVALEASAPLTYPTVVDSKPVRAVSLFLFVKTIFGGLPTQPGLSHSGAGNAHVEYGQGLDNCGDILLNERVPYGSGDFKVHVDDTLVVDITSAPVPDTSDEWEGDFHLGFGATLWLPGVVLVPGSGAGTVPARWSVGRPPHHTWDDIDPFSASYLFWSNVEPTESLPAELSLTWTFTNVLYEDVVFPGEHTGPTPLHSPATVWDHVTAYVDVYPWIERDAPVGGSAMVV